jgi:hypothetical protein
MEQTRVMMEGISTVAQWLLEQTNLAQRVTPTVREQIDAVLGRRPNDRPRTDALWRDMKLREQFGVTRRMMRSYARELRGARAQFVCKEVVQALAALEEMPLEMSTEIQQRSHMLLLAKISQALNTAETMLPEQLLKMADALSKQHAASVKAQAQALALRKFERVARAALRSKKSPAETEAEIHERIRRIYGIRLSSGPERKKEVVTAGQGNEPAADRENA